MKDLTDRELEVLKLISEGYSIKEIGEQLFYARSSINGCLLRIYNNLGAINAPNAVAIAFREGILE